MKLNITPGPWGTFRKDNGKSYSIHVTDTSFAEVYLPFNADDEVELEANAAAIVTAVNNTYHKGINPEAVPGMLEALKNYIQLIHDTIPFHEESIIYKQAVELLQKATL